MEKLFRCFFRCINIWQDRVVFPIDVGLVKIPLNHNITQLVAAVYKIKRFCKVHDGSDIIMFWFIYGTKQYCPLTFDVKLTPYGFTLAFKIRTSGNWQIFFEGEKYTSVSVIWPITSIDWIAFWKKLSTINWWVQPRFSCTNEVRIQIMNHSFPTHLSCSWCFGS